VVSLALPRWAERLWLKSCLHPQPNTTGGVAGALTVAGQWRSFTAFPSILAIAVVNCAALEGAAERHGTFSMTQLL
jgi:hypothetical protein